MKTLSGPCRYEEVIKKSRFIAHASPVMTQADTLQFYELVSEPGASHNCWAWTIDHIHRSNDDGEPSGSAGRPILATIEGRGLERVMIIVTRYFGGTRLGIGGLVRAYGGCAAKCLDRAQVIERLPRVRCEMHFDFALCGAVHGVLEQFGAEKQNESFDEKGAAMTIVADEHRLVALERALADISRGQLRFRRLGLIA